MSGGLDSMLAARLVQAQGIEVCPIHFVSVFNCGAKPGARLAARKAAEALGCKLKVVNFADEQLEIVKKPPHGYGSAANPCIDCHMAMLKRAAEYMTSLGADFIVTGEVLGQRPMSQRAYSLALIDRETGLEGLILRPLSAKAMTQTEPEKKGLVDRGKLEDITGRSRTRQMELAKEFGLTAYPTPAGGCLLTDPEFGKRVLDLVEHGQLELNEAHLLKVGRHYRLDARTKVIVGRNHRENAVLETFTRKGDVLLELADMMGPTALLRGDTGEKNVALAAALCARCSKAKGLPSAKVLVREARSAKPGRTVEVRPATDEEADAVTLAKATSHDA